MPLIVTPNGNYGGTAVTQKYSPLELKPVETYPAENRNADQQIYSGLLRNRRKLLTDRGLTAGPLRIAVPNWQTIATAEVGRLPPLVVISSNRSGWIAQGIANGDLKAAILDLNNGKFAGVTDLRALELGGVMNAQGRAVNVSPPLYAPARLGPNPNRGVYVVVHILEYATYREALEAHGITVVGFDFKIPGNDYSERISGFGASRYAAVAFCKELRAQSIAANANANHWDYAWLLDDNVVAFTSFPGLAAVENAMQASAIARPPRVQAAAGLHGDSAAKAFQSNADYARDHVGDAVPALEAPDAEPEILQQAVLWNIRYLSENNLNFGLGYITSGEDVSLGNHFRTNRAGAARTPIPYFWYKGITVRKEVPTFQDDSDGYRTFAAMRAALTRSVVRAESETPDPPNPPPPVMVQTDNGHAEKLQDFVVRRVLGSKPEYQEVNKRRSACSQAVEQLTCGALARNDFFYVDGPARTATFSTAGNNAIAIERRDQA